MQQLLYISKSRIHANLAGYIIPEMVFNARQKNERLGITGALIFTGTNFAQVLEGPKEVIGCLMSSVCCDPRHHSIAIIQELSIKERQFADWRMAYLSPPQLVSLYVSSFVNCTTRSEQLERAEELVALAEISSLHQSPLGHFGLS